MEQNDSELNLPTSDSTPPTDPTRSKSFLFSYLSKSQKGPMTNEDKEAFFYTWYNNGKPHAPKLHDLLAEKFPDKFIPTSNTLEAYVPEFKRRALQLDAEAHQQIEAAVIAEKVEMLKRHAVTGKKMQDLALDYIEGHKDEISVPAAVRLLVEGVRIERESLGIPQALEKMSRMTDEQLLEEVKKLMTSGPVTLEELDASAR